MRLILSQVILGLLLSEWQILIFSYSTRFELFTTFASRCANVSREIWLESFMGNSWKIVFKKINSRKWGKWRNETLERNVEFKKMLNFMTGEFVEHINSIKSCCFDVFTASSFRFVYALMFDYCLRCWWLNMQTVLLNDFCRHLLVKLSGRELNEKLLLSKLGSTLFFENIFFFSCLR